MSAAAVVEAIDVREHLALRIISDFMFAVMDQFSLDPFEEALLQGIVVTTGFAARLIGSRWPAAFVDTRLKHLGCRDRSDGSGRDRTFGH
ncbi:hypothetical protein [Bradyrhizobium yuanmingense]|uniref:hypothetical protein n=1 Tax=Bradyrhizobium yuanmingense TaxID=108015 RepID=UPI0023B8D4C4|nr:hypothetical protein [Bradyrhizobium yuanmingense]MDF0498968.1 hypothetical protein [Bradyrhizobium yuanmingense]